jgi:DNA-binding IclR family transcriptional regulator
MTLIHTTSRTMSDVLALSDIERAVVNHIIRQRHGSLAQLSQQLEQPTDDLHPLLTQLVIEGFLSTIRTTN